MEYGTWDETVEDFLNGMSGNAPNTIRFYECQLRQLVTWAKEHDKAFLEFKAADMRAYCKYRSGIVSRRTQLHDCRAAKHFFKFCSHAGYRETNILHDYSVPKAPRAHVKKPCEQDILALLKAIEDRWSPAKNNKCRFQSEDYRKFVRARDRALTCFLVETGCRIGEALALTMQMLDIPGQCVTFPKTKTGNPRTIPFTEALAVALRPWIALRSRLERDSHVILSDHFFINRVGGGMDTAQWGDTWRAYLDFAGIERFTRHSIRHFTIHRMATVNVRSAQVLAGHKHLNTTELYLHDDPDQVRRDHAEAAPLGNVLVNERSKKQMRARVSG